jgi:hypothetical protein
MNAIAVYIDCIQPPEGLGDDFHGELSNAAGNQFWTCDHAHGTCDQAKQLIQAGEFVRLGEALVTEGQEFSAEFETPGRPARDLVGRMR